MNNEDLQATWHYHNGTKHPGGRLMSPAHRFDPSHQPLLFKIYTDLPPLSLPLDSSPSLPALKAIANETSSPNSEPVLDLPRVARLLYFSAGITKTIQYPSPWGEMPFRAAACTGALYHIEIYLVCGDLPDLEAGVYHFDPQGFALRQLRRGDYRQVLISASGQEARVAEASATLILTDVVWRNAVKYQAREYRHAFWDSGTILANTLALATAHRLSARVVLGFVDDAVSHLLDLDPARELALALIPLGRAATAVPPAPPVASLEFAIEPYSPYELDFPAIRAMHSASSLLGADTVATWRSNSLPVASSEPVGTLTALHPLEADELPNASIEQVISKRGSARVFAREALSFRQLSTALASALHSLNADFLPAPGAFLNQAYLLVHAVEGLAVGAYVYHPALQALELLQPGHFREIGGYLGLHQALAADASVDIFFLANLPPILASLGNRGYRAAQLEASLLAGRLYLAAYALGFGATGLTFFDDAVIECFSPHAHGKSVMFFIALGKKGKRSAT